MAVSGSGFSTGWLTSVNQTLGFDNRQLKEASRDFYFGQPAGGPISVNLTLQTLTVLNRTPAVQISAIINLTLQSLIIINRAVGVSVGVSVVLTKQDMTTTHRAPSVLIPGSGASEFIKSRKKRRI